MRIFTLFCITSFIRSYATTLYTNLEGYIEESSDNKSILQQHIFPFYGMLHEFEISYGNAALGRRKDCLQHRPITTILNTA